MELLLIALGLLAIFLLTRRWFWLAALGVGCLASIFAMLASIIHFQILGALGFAFLAYISGASALLVLTRWPAPESNVGEA